MRWVGGVARWILEGIHYWMLRLSANRIVLRVEGTVVVMPLIAIMKKVLARGEPCEPIKHNCYPQK